MVNLVADLEPLDRKTNTSLSGSLENIGRQVVLERPLQIEEKRFYFATARSASAHALIFALLSRSCRCRFLCCHTSVDFGNGKYLSADLFTELDPENGHAYLNFEAVLGGKGLRGEALTHFRAATRLMRADQRVIYSLAYLLEDGETREEIAEADGLYGQVIAMDIKAIWRSRPARLAARWPSAVSTLARHRPCGWTR